MKTCIFNLLLFMTFISCHSSQVNNHVIRLKPGADLKQSIQQFVQQNKIEAGWIVTCAGSLTDVSLRLANQPDSLTMKGHFEIVSLTGTVSVNGSHLHMSVADSTGKCTGGHLTNGNIIYTTAEIVLQSSDELRFTREKDGSTPWEELQVKKK